MWGGMVAKRLPSVTASSAAADARRTLPAASRPPHRPGQALAQRQRPPPPPPGQKQRQQQPLLVVARAAPYQAAPASREDEELQMWMDRLAGMPPSMRSVAVLQLLRIEQDGAFAGLVGGSPDTGGDDGEDGEGEGEGGQRLRHWSKPLDDRDVRWVTEAVNGITRWRRRLDYILGALLNRDPASLDAPLRQILRLGLYELVEMRSPTYTVNEHVELAKRVMHKGAGNVANGVLRNVARQMAAGELPQPPAPVKGMSPQQAAEALAVGSSHPTWLVQGWLEQYGAAATMALTKHNNQRPHHALRLAPGQDPAAVCERLQDIGVKAAPSRYLPNEFITVSGGLQALLASGMLKRGEAQVQDEAAGLVVAMLDPQPGDSVLDACAAPGGKTMFCAARMQGRGSVLALDVSRVRLAALREMAARQEHGGIVKTRIEDLRHFAGLQREAAALQQADQGSGRQGGQYDRVLLDAPCSGTGVLAKRADLRWRRQPAQVAQMASLQGELLRAAAGLVAPGGLLVYSTCSIEWQENQQQVETFLQQHPEFAVEPPPSAGAGSAGAGAGSAAGGVPQECLDEQGFLRMLPHVHGTDGAFAARLRRRA